MRPSYIVMSTGTRRKNGGGEFVVLGGVGGAIEDDGHEHTEEIARIPWGPGLYEYRSLDDAEAFANMLAASLNKRGYREGIDLTTQNVSTVKDGVVTV